MSTFLEVPRIARELAIGPALGPGIQGRDSKRLQELLTLAGYRTAIDGDFGPATLATLKAFQKAHSLDITGVSTRETWIALTQRMRLTFSYQPEAARTLREAVALVARRHGAYNPREVGGDNRGPWVRAYCAADGPGYRWCAGAALTIVQQAAHAIAEPFPLTFTLSCDALADFAAKHGRLTRDPRLVHAGDLFLLLNRRDPSDRIHVGIVDRMHVDHFETWEGNTNDEGSPNGFEYCARRRALSRYVEFIRLA